MHYLISSNASHSIYLFLAQWRHISSESVISHVWRLFPTFQQCSHLFITILATQMLCHELHGMFYTWCQMWQELQENCVINAPNGKSSKTAVLVQCDLWFYIKQQSPRRPCDNNKKNKNLVKKSLWAQQWHWQNTLCTSMYFPVTYISQLASRASDVWCWLISGYWQAWLLFMHWTYIGEQWLRYRLLGLQVLGGGVILWVLGTQEELNFIEGTLQTAGSQYWNIGYTGKKESFTSCAQGLSST